ncbi:signal peptidase I [Rhodococcus sp. OK302]|nr:signal peptidase I [Rhodococcus sp. OK302]
MPRTGADDWCGGRTHLCPRRCRFHTFGIKPLVFRSGSMSPEITTGSLALARSVPATDLVVGDIVSVINEQGTRITHRVYDMESQTGNSVDVWLKGDANTVPDTETYSVTEADRIFFSVGGLGYAVAWLSSPIAVFLGGAFVAGLLMVAFRPNSRKDDSEDGPSGGVANSDTESVEAKKFSLVSAGSGTAGLRSSLSLRKLTILGVSALAVFGATQVSGTVAAFTISSVAKSGQLKVNSNIVPAPSDVTCTTNGIGGSQSATVKWPHLGPAFKYVAKYYYRNGSSDTFWKDYPVDPGVAAAVGSEVSITMKYTDGGYSGTGYMYTVRVVSVNRITTQTGTDWRGYNLWQPGAQTSIGCDSANAGVQSLQALQDSPTAESRMIAPTTSPTTTPTVTTTAPVTTDVATTTKTSTSATESATPTTTTSATTTTTTPSKEVPIAVGDPETSSNGDTATLMQTSAGVAVVVTNSAGKEISSTPVGATAEVKWQSDSEVLWIVDGTDIYQVSSSGKSTKATAADAPADIAAWIDGLK